MHRPAATERLVCRRSGSSPYIASVALVSVIALALVGLLATSVWPNAAAQDVAPDATAGHPVVGAWWWENISADPFDDSDGIFHADGTYVEETTYIGAGIGAWEATRAARSAAA